MGDLNFAGEKPRRAIEGVDAADFEPFDERRLVRGDRGEQHPAFAKTAGESRHC